eukprot:3671735-Rhodomonas_salina.1
MGLKKCFQVRRGSETVLGGWIEHPCTTTTSTTTSTLPTVLIVFNDTRVLRLLLVLVLLVVLSDHGDDCSSVTVDSARARCAPRGGTNPGHKSCSVQVDSASVYPSHRISALLRIIMIYNHRRATGTAINWHSLVEENGQT